MVRVPAMMATTGPPNRPAMHSTTERASKITPGIKTRGINMPTTQMPPNSTPETICPTRGLLPPEPDVDAVQKAQRQ